MWVTVKIYTSKGKVDINEFKDFCLKTYNMLLTKFNNEHTKWISILPTAHALLALGWELISMNDELGLGDFTEWFGA